ncbi:MAG: LigC protein, partial [Planctomycetaceae bacterium]|nr:LigC protein [Planctomycetaceae bacterium]
DGPHTFQVRATDPAGNSTTASRSFQVDTTPPMVTITPGVGGNTSTPTFNLSAPEPVTFECRIDNGEFVSSLPQFTTPFLADGVYVLEVRATDSAGNVGTGTHQFTVDTAPATLISIEVTPVNETVAAGFTRQFIATGIFSDASLRDLTSDVTWTSTRPAVASVSNAVGSSGLAATTAPGTTEIAAVLDSVMGSTVLNVTDAVLTSIDVTPLNPTVAAGLTRQFTATGTFSDASTLDLTSSVTWASTNHAIAIISNAVGSQGLATAAATGTTAISASQNGVLGTTVFTVTEAALISIEVTPHNPEVAIGLTQQFSAAGLFSDGSSQDLTSSVTWASATTAVATISSTGLAETLAAGTSVMTASRDGVTGSTSLTVLSVDDQLAILRARVIAFRSECVLTHGRAHSLLAKLNLHGNDRDVHKVEAFLKKVHAQTRAGIFTEEQADTLLRPGSILLLSVQRHS